MPSSTTLPATLDALPAALAFTEAAAEAAGVGPAKLPGLVLAVEEAFVNICSYAYKDGKGDVSLACPPVADAFVLEIADSGPRFNPLSVSPPDLSLPVETRPAGGLGIHFIRKFTDHSVWRRENHKNILRLTIDLV